MSIFSKIFGGSDAQLLKKFGDKIRAINEKETALSALTGDELRVKSDELKSKIRSGTPVDDVLPDAFALVREAARRTLNQRHYDVQLVGGFIIHQGAIAEMRTGEGKTLVATLPAYVNALTAPPAGGGVHVVTVNDYLARRDAVWMGQIYHALGLTVGCIMHDASYRYDPAHAAPAADAERDMQGSFRVVHEFLRPCSRREAYAADITYGTNNEFGFDYLRDHLVYRPSDQVQRGHHFAIVDEVDSILIDEARTPLIISAPDAESSELYKKFTGIAAGLESGRDFTVDEKLRAVSLTDEGITRAERALGIANLYGEGGGIKQVHHLEQAVRAKALYQRDKDYVVKNNEVIIVDEFTGRLMPGRRWSEGLHQAVEAKEGVKIQQESRTVASITFQNYFRLYAKLSGMTGTASTSAEEFHKVYNLEVITIPTHKPLIRRDLSDRVFQTENAKWNAVVGEIRRRHEQGQPVLVGTVSIQKNEHLAELLKRAGIPYQVLNAKNHEEEAKIIAQAGRRGAVTVATNMAGRGVDIILGGNPPDSTAADAVRAAGGLFVLGTDRHEARRIDNQLRGRAGRQGDAGETQFFVSFDDDLLRIFGASKMKTMMQALKIPEDEAVENRMVSRAIESAQSKVEGFSFDTRKHLLEYDDVANMHRQAIYRRRTELLMMDDPMLIAEMRGMLDNVQGSTLDTFDAREKEVGTENFSKILRAIWLQTYDHFWMEHLEAMEYMRSSVRLRAYGQRDPLVEYKNEGARLFQGLQDSIDTHVIELALRMVSSPAPEIRAIKEVRPVVPLTSTPTSPGAEAGRNDPCPCGSGKKYKKCHGV